MRKQIAMDKGFAFTEAIFDIPFGRERIKGSRKTQVVSHRMRVNERGQVRFLDHGLSTKALLVLHNTNGLTCRCGEIAHLLATVREYDTWRIKDRKRNAKSEQRKQLEAAGFTADFFDFMHVTVNRRFKHRNTQPAPLMQSWNSAGGPARMRALLAEKLAEEKLALERKYRRRRNMVKLYAMYKGFEKSGDYPYIEEPV